MHRFFSPSDTNKTFLRGAEDDLHTLRPTLGYQPTYTWVDLYLDFSLGLDASRLLLKYML